MRHDVDPSIWRREQRGEQGVLLARLIHQGAGQRAAPAVGKGEPAGGRHDLWSSVLAEESRGAAMLVKRER